MLRAPHLVADIFEQMIVVHRPQGNIAVDFLKEVVEHSAHGNIQVVHTSSCATWITRAAISTLTSRTRVKRG